MSDQYAYLRQKLNHLVQQDGGLLVFEYYGYTPSRRAQKTNPFRNEKTSSFFITEKFGKIIFKDFGDDSFKGDCWKFVQLFEKCNYQQSLEILAKIYGIGYTQIHTTNRSRTRLPKKEKRKQASKKLLEIQFKEFSNEELQFWQNKGNIDLTTLMKNKVQSVKSFKIQYSEGQVREYVNLSFIFSYEIVPNEAYKLYMPKSAYRVYGQAKTVFLPNLDPARKKIHPEYTYHFGMETLDKNLPTILCAGEPDCLALKAAGYNAFTLGDERANLPEYIQQKLQSDIPNASTNLENLSVLYDTDYTGLKSSLILAQKYGIQRLVLPKLKKQKSSDHPKPTHNDVCDYLGIYGWDEDLELLLHQQTFRNRDYHLKQVPCFEVKKYLVEKTEVLTRFIQKYKRIQIDANAGIGKTYTLLSRLPEKLNKPILFVVPFAIQVEQIEQEYQNQVDGLVCFGNQHVNGFEDEEFAFRGKSIGKINVCTYDRVKKVYDFLNQDSLKDLLIVVDESHLLTSEYAYRTQAIHNVLEICQKADKIVYLSATPDYTLCQFSGFRLIRFQRAANPSIHIQAYDYQGSPKKALLKLLLISQQTTQQGITIVRLNNKTLAKVLANLLVEKNLYQEGEIDFVFSEKRIGINTPAKESIVNTSKIPDQVRLLFVTACFDCGINILNQNVQNIISFETRHTDNCKDTFKQFVARFRELAQVKIWVCKPIHYQEYPPLKERSKLYTRLEKEARNKLSLLPYNDLQVVENISQGVHDIARFGLNTPKTPKYIKANLDISATHKLLKKEENQYTVNYNYIRFSLKEYERKCLNSNHFYQELIEELPNTRLCKRNKLDLKANDPHFNQLDSLLKEEKELKKTRIHTVCQVMNAKPAEFFNAVHHEYRDLTLKRKIKSQYIITPRSTSVSLAGLLDNNPVQKTNLRKNTPNIHHFDEEIITLSHRYFYLKDLLIPEHKIPGLLEKHASDIDFGKLCKILNNQISILVWKKAGSQLSRLITDQRKLDDIHWLALVRDEIKEWHTTTYQQKKSAGLKSKLKSLHYDLKLLQYRQRNVFFEAVGILTYIQQGAKLKSQYRSIKRNYKSIQRKIGRLRQKISQLENQYQQSIIQGIELNTLSERLNKLRTYYSDHQGVTANLRIVSSLFETKVQRRAILTKDQAQVWQYQEKQIVTIGSPLEFDQAMEQLGFTDLESKHYQEYLEYQIQLDLVKNQRFLSKNLQKSQEPPIDRHDPSAKTAITDHKNKIRENKHGYPDFWDQSV